MPDNFREQKILIVDDEPVNIRILTENLKGSYQLIGATGGREAIECTMSTDPPDLILLDIIMPDMDGYQVCQRLKTDPITRDIPVIFITVMGEDVNEAHGFELGAVDYIAKPFSPAIVNARVQTHLELKRHRDRLERTLHERTEKLSHSTQKLKQASHERMLAEEDRNRLTTAIEQAAEAFVITDPDGLIQYVNPTFERHTGYSREEAMGRNVGMLQSEENDEAFYKDIRNTVRQGNTWRGMFTNQRKDGSSYKAESAVSPVFDTQGRVVNIVSVSRDVTREVELEAHLRRAQKLEAIGTLAGGIAHDFNNIICAILGYTELAMFSIPKESDARQYLERIEQGGRRAADLISQILAFGRKGEQERQSMRIQPVIREALKLLRGTLPSTIRIEEKMDETCKPILAAPTQVYQIIMNLCTNAYHAMRDQGASVLKVGLTEMATDSEQIPGSMDMPPGHYVCLTVKDNGHGMDQGTLGKIFDPYFTTKAVGEGTGLGLSTVYGIVREFGGVVSAESEPGQGTTFHVFFPVHETDDTLSEEFSDLKRPPSAGLRVLVVDDEEPIARMIETKLIRLGYKVRAYTDSVEALDAFQASPDDVDLIIADTTMPNLTGIQFSEEVFRIRPDIPIILCTGYSEMVTEEQAKVMGIRNFLKKPFIDGELEKTVEKSCKPEVASLKLQV